jgi:hypothetical protein
MRNIDSLLNNKLSLLKVSFTHTLICACEKIFYLMFFWLRPSKNFCFEAKKGGPILGLGIKKKLIYHPLTQDENIF